MNKKSIDFILKEIKELEVLSKSLYEFEEVPSVIFQLMDSKLESIKNIYSQLSIQKTEEKEPVLTTDDVVIKKEEMPEEILKEPTLEELIKATSEEETLIEEEIKEAEPKMKKNIIEKFSNSSSVHEKMSAQKTNTFDDNLLNKKISDLKKA